MGFGATSELASSLWDTSIFRSPGFLGFNWLQPEAMVVCCGLRNQPRRPLKSSSPRPFKLRAVVIWIFRTRPQSLQFWMCSMELAYGDTLFQSPLMSQRAPQFFLDFVQVTKRNAPQELLFGVVVISVEGPGTQGTAKIL